MYTFTFFFSGHSSVWFGSIDIVFTSPYPKKETQEQAAKLALTVDDIPAIAKAVEEEEEEEDEEEEKNAEQSVEGKC